MIEHYTNFFRLKPTVDTGSRYVLFPIAISIISSHVKSKNICANINPQKSKSNPKVKKQKHFKTKKPKTLQK